MSGKIKCQTCGREVHEDEFFISGSQTLCENCYMDAGSRIRICDPWGERSKLVFRESHGLTGTDGLTDLQKEIYEYIKSWITSLPSWGTASSWKARRKVTKFTWPPGNRTISKYASFTFSWELWCNGMVPLPECFLLRNHILQLMFQHHPGWVA